MGLNRVERYISLYPIADFPVCKRRLKCWLCVFLFSRQNGAERKGRFFTFFLPPFSNHSARHRLPLLGYPLSGKSTRQLSNYKRKKYWLYKLPIYFSYARFRIFTDDAALITYTTRSMRIYLAVLLIYGVQVACQYSFVALDQAPKAIFLTIWRKIILLIPLIFLLPHLWPDAVTGVYLAEPIADTIAVCTTAPMFYAYYRKLK